MTSAHLAASATLEHLQPGGLGLLGRLARRRQPDDHVDAAVLEVQRVRVTLRAIADHGDLPRADQVDIRILVVEHRRHCVSWVAGS